MREVKDEIRQLIDELKNLSAKNETLRIQNDNANTKIRSLTEESKAWKTKYDSISMELRSFKVRSVQMDHQDLSKDYFLKPNPDGAIGHQYVIEYQTAIDELMKTSRYLIKFLVFLFQSFFPFFFFDFSFFIFFFCFLGQVNQPTFCSP